MATTRSYKLNKLLNSLTASPYDLEQSKQLSICAFCCGPAESFTDLLSVKEYYISGLCQRCQDKTFGKD